MILIFIVMCFVFAFYMSSKHGLTNEQEAMMREFRD